MLYACDGKWWKQKRGVPEFGGLKVSQDIDTCTKFLDVCRVEAQFASHFLVEQPAVIATGNEAGGNSGFQALNLAVQFRGPGLICLVGFDMRLDLGSHWHGNHKGDLSNPKLKNVLKWRRILNEAAPQLARLGVHVVNASPVSALTAFPLVKLTDVL